MRAVSTNWTLRNEIQEFMYSKVTHHISEKIQEIAEENGALTGSNSTTFAYRGEVYNSVITNRTYVKPEELHPSLRARMDTILSLQEDARRERDYTMNFITKVLNKSRSHEDYLAILPDCIHKPILGFLDQLEAMPRMLDGDDIKDLMRFNQKSYDLIKKRMLANMLL